MLMKNNKLQYLDIGSNDIGNVGVKLITEGLRIQYNNTLIELDAVECNISVEGRYT